MYCAFRRQLKWFGSANRHRALCLTVVKAGPVRDYGTMRLSRWWGVAVGAVAGATLAVLVLERCREAPRPEQPTSTGPGDGKAEPEREATDSDTQPEWDIDLLKTIYQADRAQQSSDLAVALALVGAFIAYVSATLAFPRISLRMDASPTSTGRSSSSHCLRGSWRPITHSLAQHHPFDRGRLKRSRLF